ncbi:hypothetical protein Purlil1_2561 [Purpureocillium lilacinum]|uniref:DUF6923 domain-containing protein n=1 Tax=Purpureocillium lilacinum TaxID=33203 RepID=A0ABR0CAI7_PURLI|nr:hypothetical protein Purlil1_2561 [Purpureocillium lilacinum]
MLAHYLFALVLAAGTPLAAGKPTSTAPPDATASAEWFLCDLLGCASETTVTRTRWRTTTTTATASITLTVSQTCELCSTTTPVVSSTAVTTSSKVILTTTTTSSETVSASTTAALNTTLISTSISSEVPTSIATSFPFTNTTTAPTTTMITSAPFTNSTTAPTTSIATYSLSLNSTSTSGTTVTLTSAFTSSSVISSVPASSKTSWIPITNSTSKPSTTAVSSTRWLNTTRTSAATTTPTSNITLSSVSSSFLNSSTTVSRIANGTVTITPSTTLAPTSGFPSSSVVVTTTAGRSVPSPSKLQPFECLTDGYLIQSKTLLQVNLRTGARRVLATDVGGHGVPGINSLGYNPLDNYLYGTQGQALVRIGRDGRTEPVLALPSAANLGDVDIAGQYFFSDSGAAWGQVDLAPGSPRYGQLVAAGNATHGGLRRLSDWAFTPAHPGYAYSVAIDNRRVPTLARWSTETHEWETVRRYDDTKLRATLFGAVMATSDGVVYASDNASGQIFRFPLRDPASASKAGVGPRARSSDGARCALAPDASE